MFVPAGEKAKAIIMSGNVYVDGQKEDKAGTTFPEEVKKFMDEMLRGGNL